jgi:hypothetical protein
MDDAREGVTPKRKQGGRGHREKRKKNKKKKKKA